MELSPTSERLERAQTSAEISHLNLIDGNVQRHACGRKNLGKPGGSAIFLSGSAECDFTNFGRILPFCNSGTKSRRS